MKSTILFLFIIFCSWLDPLNGLGQNFPPINMIIQDSSATEGYIFLVPYTNSPVNTYDHAQMILDRYGRIVFYRIFQKGLTPTPTIDFKLQPNGQMSYFHIGKKKYFLVDSTLSDVDSIACINGFETDQHDLQILPDGHFLLFGSEVRIMNLSSYHWFGFNHNQPGSSSAEVSGVVIQEFDENKQLVWQWKGHDHYQFSDVSPDYLFNPNKVDWTHANSVERDTDGNILVSLRHFNEITKIDHTTGNILWRLGGKMNQFSFPNDPVRFTGQHDIRRVSDTSVSIFDNGQYSNPPSSRGVEYALDEENKVATLAWEYVYNPSMSSSACGNHQYIANGNHLVDFGYVGQIYPWMVIVKPDKTQVLEIHYPPGFISYRAFNYPELPWQLDRPEVDCQKMGSQYYLVAEPGHNEYRWSTGETTSFIEITDTGIYNVFVPYGAGYISSEYIYITDPENPCIPVSNPEAEPSAAFSLNINPNPAQDQVMVTLNLPSSSRALLTLQTLTGNEVYKQPGRTLSSGRHNLLLDVSSLPRGLYLLILTTDQGRVVEKVVLR